MNFYPTILAQETKQKNKQTRKQSNLLTLTVLCDKTSCLIRSEKKKQSKTERKENIKKSRKMTMEAITMKIGNDSKSEHVEKKKQTIVALKT